MVTLTEVTDPLCTWCWGVEPVRRRVEATYGDQVDVAFVMGGLVADFDAFADPANGITDPADVAPHWEAAAGRHGMPVDAGIWHEDPPDSSFPASVAYHAAALQAPGLAKKYLRRTREAVATERRNVARRPVLVDLAREVGLDVGAFEAALDGDRARAAFDEDRRFARRNDATAFPTFHVEGPGGERWLRGAQSFAAPAEALETVDSSLVRHDPRPIPAFVEAHGPVATREIATVYDRSHEDALGTLRDLERDGVVRAIERGTGVLWTACGIEAEQRH